MRKFSLILVTILIFSVMSAQDVIVYTAHQNFDSRIYVMDMQGAVLDYFEYANYRMLDLEVVNNEVYVTDAFIPCVYKFNVINGNLELIVHDITLYYFYGIAYDGNYFYLNEWDMNRYDINGDKFGTASFDQSVHGSCWDDEYLWTLDEGEISCWDISNWPNIVEITANNFSAPTAECRGLWFDGENFWSAESKESLGSIYKFDYAGNVIQQWLEPAFKGWSACTVDEYFSTEESNQNEMSSSLKQNQPNPVILTKNSSTEFNFYLNSKSHIKFKVYDLKGRLIKELVSAEFSHGNHSIVWKDIQAPPGVYLYHLETDKIKTTKKMLILK